MYFIQSILQIFFPVIFSTSPLLLFSCYFISCYFFSCYFFPYFPTVTFFPVTFFPVTFFPVTFFRYFFSCYFLSYNQLEHHRLSALLQLHLHSNLPNFRGLMVYHFLSDRQQTIPLHPVCLSLQHQRQPEAPHRERTRESEVRVQRVWVCGKQSYSTLASPAET